MVLLNPPSDAQAWTRRLPRRRLSLKLNGLVSETRSVTDNRNRCDARYFESPIQMSQRAIGLTIGREGDVRDGIGSQLHRRARRSLVGCVYSAAYTAYRPPNARAPAGGPTSSFRRYPSDWNKTGTGGGRERIFASVLSSEYSDKSILKLPTRPRLALALPV